MSLLGILNIGNSALAAQQAALQVTGNNLANAGDPNYTREVANQSPTADSVGPSGLMLGNGVAITSVQRQVDTALQSRLLSANSDQSSSSTLQTWSGQVQSVFNALSGNGLSDQLNSFFNNWSTLANNPSDAGQRQVVLQSGQNVAQTFNGLASNLTTLDSNVQSAVGQAVTQVNQLTSQIANLNQQIVAGQSSGQQPNSLLDQRDTALTQLSNLANIQTVTQPTGSINVFIGSEAIVQNSTSYALTAGASANNGHVDTSVDYADGSAADITGGQIGGLSQAQALIDNTSDSVNSLANNLISSLNTLHASGQGLDGFTTTTGTNSVNDPAAALSAAGLKYPPQTGSVVVQLTNQTTGQTTSTLLQVNENGSPTDTTLNSFAASLNGISGVQASIAAGKLTISSTDPNEQISFSQDTSGVLAGLGINTFFNGSDASTIAVNSQLLNNPSLLAASANNNPDDNTTALAIANFNDTPQPGLAGSSLSTAYGTLVQTVGSAAATATSNASSAGAVQQTLTAQQQSLSGVSTDEEALNMIIEQRTYQGAAQLISVVNQMLQSLLAIT